MPPQEEPPAIRHLEDSHTPEAVRSRLTGDVAPDEAHHEARWHHPRLAADLHPLDHLVHGHAELREPHDVVLGVGEVVDLVDHLLDSRLFSKEKVMMQLLPKEKLLKEVTLLLKRNHIQSTK